MPGRRRGQCWALPITTVVVILSCFLSVGSAIPDPSEDAVEQCCFMCEGRNCLGCWGKSSVCNKQDNCLSDTCGGQWVADPVVVHRVPSSHGCEAEPQQLYTSAMLDPPLRPVASEEFIYTTSGSFMDYNPDSGIPEVTQPWIEKIEAATGALVWRKNVSEPKSKAYLSSPPIVSDGMIFLEVFYASQGPSLVAYKGDTGDEVYNFPMDDGEFVSRVSVGLGLFFYMGNDYKAIVARQTDNHEFFWQAPFGGEVVSDITPPAVAQGLVLKTGSSNNANFVYAFNVTTGKEQWSLQCIAQPWMTRVANGPSGVIYIGMTFFPQTETGVWPIGEAHSMLITKLLEPNKPVPNGLSMRGVIKQPVVRNDPNRNGPIIHYTLCTKPIVNGAPPLWWLDCDVYAIDSSKMAESSRRSVVWRLTGPPDAVLSDVVLSGDVLYVSGVVLVNGTWPNCTWPYQDMYPSCTYPDSPNPLDDLPFHFTDPFLMAIGAEDGKLLWKIPVDIGNFSIISFNWSNIIHDLVTRDSKADERPLWMPGDGSAYNSAGLMHAMGRYITELLPLPWVIMPWDDFTIDVAGKRLVYATQDGVVGLDVSSTGLTSYDDLDWMAPLAGATSGVACIVIFVVAVRRYCAEKEEQQINAEKDGLLKRRRMEGYSTTDGSGSMSTGSARISPEEERGYTIIRQLGKGGFGNVYLVRRHTDDAMISLKKIICRCERDTRIARREVSILTSLPEHPGLVRILDSFAQDGAVCLVMPFYEQGDLSTFISQYPAPVLPEALVVSFSRQIAEVLTHLHSQTPPVVHRDLKPENILIAQDRQHVVLADFGLSRMVDKTYMHTHAGTMAFMAPEAFDGPYDTKVDIWSLGCIVYAMCMRRSRNCRVMCVHVGRRDFYTDITQGIADRGYSEFVVDLVRQMLQTNRHARPTAEEIAFRLGEDAPATLRLGSGSGDDIPTGKREKDTAKRKNGVDSTAEKDLGFLARWRGRRFNVQHVESKHVSEAPHDINGRNNGSDPAPDFVPPGLIRGAAAPISESGYASVTTDDEESSQAYHPAITTHNGNGNGNCHAPPMFCPPAAPFAAPYAPAYATSVGVMPQRGDGLGPPVSAAVLGMAAPGDSIITPGDDDSSDAWAPPSPPPPAAAIIQSIV
eukprot:TRINITY_DN3137_c1_g2_i1.p1 TRINITY_DN3137_c1_g2~~TRINITY_DN3137_c1_g2_i1.p1  ORF type:complete len:1175 (+),score=355.67 TRINITY_DN3137_c1_g2_i1:108-3527(+)